MSIRKGKLGVVPKPRGAYSQAKVESDGNGIVVVTPMPSVHNRDHAKPSSGTDQFSKLKPATHGRSGNYKIARGRDYTIETVQDAKENVGAAKRARKSQMGSNQRLGN
jgi:hypothetical protein